MKIMKKRLFILALCSFYFINVSAQTEKGRFALSGKTDLSAMFSQTSLVVDSSVAGKSQKSRAFKADIGVAFFVAKNLSFSVSGTFRYSGVESDNFGFTHNYTAGVIPGVTYFIPLKGNLKPTISAGAGYIWYFTSDLDAEGLSLNMAPGVSWFFNKNISLDFGVQYAFNDLKNKYYNHEVKYQQQTVGLLFGLSVYF